MNKIITTAQLREDFICYFRGEKHKYLNPSKVFIDDPTLFFVNAGMNQLKNIFTGKKEYDENFSKLVNCQTCIRAGGKHNDLDDVGKDTYHLTSFGMLGNWSLNKYWKDDTIKMAFEYLTKKCNFEKQRMYATYFEGNSEIPEDIESRDIWRKYLPDDHIIPGSFKDNFWTMGETGPCGSCTEIHYDLLESKENRANLVNKGDPTLIEIWNMVFMEYNMEYDQKNIVLNKLEKKFVDTGMGLERLAMIMQKKKSIYETDIFRKLISYAEIMSNCEKYTDKYEMDSLKDIAYRIFADHFRTCVISIFDGVTFDCVGRGFILRKIFRRLLMNYYLYLNNFMVQSLSKHHAIEALITEILNFHLLNSHNSKEIKETFIQEEMLYMGKINKFKNEYKSKLKKNTKEKIIADYLDKYDQIKSKDGMDIEIIKNIDKIEVTM